MRTLCYIPSSSNSLSLVVNTAHTILWAPRSIITLLRKYPKYYFYYISLYHLPGQLSYEGVLGIAASTLDHTLDYRIIVVFLRKNMAVDVSFVYFPTSKPGRK